MPPLKLTSASSPTPEPETESYTDYGRRLPGGKVKRVFSKGLNVILSVAKDLEAKNLAL